VTVEPTTDPRDAEIAELRAHVEALESQLAEHARRTAAVVAQSQEKLYWLERWQVDLDAVMAKPGAVPALEALKRVRGSIRAARKLKRRVTGS
jgi:hypothetical protein